MSEHSKLPWGVAPEDDENGVSYIFDSDESTVCTLTREDAEFIVRAVNSHDDLLEACKLFVTECCGCECNRCRPARAAIAKAEGERI